MLRPGGDEQPPVTGKRRAPGWYEGSPEVITKALVGFGGYYQPEPHQDASYRRIPALRRKTTGRSGHTIRWRPFSLTNRRGRRSKLYGFNSFVDHSKEIITTDPLTGCERMCV